MIPWSFVCGWLLDPDTYEYNNNTGGNVDDLQFWGVWRNDPPVSACVFGIEF